VADLAEKFSVGREFEELRSARAICRTRAVAARKDEDVAFGIHGDARGFTEIEVGGSFRKSGRSGNGFRAVVGEKRRGHEEHKTRSECFIEFNLVIWSVCTRIIRRLGISRLPDICIGLR